MEKRNFLDELLDKVELQEEEQTEAYYDLVLLQIKKLTETVEKNFNEAEKECNLINNFTLMKNAQLSERIKFLELKLRSFIIERKEKTIDLANGTLKLHKKPDKVEVTDMGLFLKNAKPELVTVIPEQVKPDINKIKAFIKTRPAPAGVTIIEGKEEFTYKLKGEKENGRENEAGASAEQISSLGIAV